MMAVHSVLASSASQPFLFDQDYPLIETSSSGSSGEALISEINMFTPSYNLEDMFTHIQFHPRSTEVYSNGVTSKFPKIWAVVVIPLHGLRA